MTIEIRRLAAGEGAEMQSATLLFNEVFSDEAYQGPPAGLDYLAKLLSDHRFIALVAREGGVMIGALAGYELVKFEGQRSEIYIYDLAVREEFRRRGVATALIGELKVIARSKGAWMIFVQADPPDEPAVALYRKLGVEERVLHFDINPTSGR